MQQMALFGRMVFAQFVLAQVVATLYIVPGYVNRSIAEEKDRKTLTFLLTTRLSSGSIVLGKLAAGLWHYLTCLLAGLPVVLLLPLFGGVQPEAVLLAYASTVSIALFVAGLSMMISVIARRGREAHRLTTSIIAFWIFGPITIAPVLSWLSPWIYGWLRPVNELILASSPAGVLGSLSGWLSRGSFLDTLGRMIGLQLSAAAFLILGAIAQLRPAWRRHEDGGWIRLARQRTRPLGRSRSRSRSRSRPACGERPVLWKELNVGRVQGATRLLYSIAWWSIVATVALAIYAAGVGAAAQEVLANGYGSVDNSSKRVLFNEYLRAMTILLSSLFGLVVTGTAAEGIIVERMRDTWLGLIATPIDCRQILWAKMFGGFWRAKGLALLLVGLWSIGLVVGAVHPLGFAAALIGLIVSAWLFAAAGTYASLRARNMEAAQSAALSLILVLALSGFLPKALPEGIRSVFYGAGSFPFVESLMLWTYREANAGITSSPSPTLTAMGINTHEGTFAVLLTCSLSVVGAALAAALLTWLAERQFDRLVGRPWRRPVDDREPGPKEITRSSLAAMPER